MATFDSLSAELKLHVLRLAAADIPRTRRVRGRKSWSERYTLLRSTALVCRAWSAPAQQLLWEVAEVRDDVEAEELILASVGRTVESLVLEGDQLSTGRAAALLRELRGMTALEANVACTLRPTDLCFPSLSNLKALTLNRTTFSSINAKTPLEIPFSLTRLALRQPNRVPPPLVSALLRPTISSLTLDASDSHGTPPYIATLIAIANGIGSNITRLDLTANDRADELLPLLRRCIGLRELRIANALVRNARQVTIQLLSATPSPLRVFTHSSQSTMDREWIDALAILQAELPALSKLKKLQLQSESPKKRKKGATDVDLRRECERQGIRLAEL